MRGSGGEMGVGSGERVCSEPRLFQFPWRNARGSRSLALGEVLTWLRSCSLQTVPHQQLWMSAASPQGDGVRVRVRGMGRGP